MSIDELLKQTTPRPWRAVNGMDRWRVENAEFYICAMPDNGRSGELDAELICLAVNAFCTQKESQTFEVRQTGWVCPQCGHALKPVTYHGGAMALNREQWESVRAGDWYCEKCKSDASKTGYKYYWNHELTGDGSRREVERPPSIGLSVASPAASEGGREWPVQCVHHVPIPADSDHPCPACETTQPPPPPPVSNERDALKAKCASLERELSINIAANNEQFQHALACINHNDAERKAAGCPVCLQRERDEARAEIQSVLTYMEKDYVKCFEGGPEEVIYTSLALSVARVRAERNDLEAKFAEKFPDIGQDPLKMDKRDGFEEAFARLKSGLDRQQSGVPDQTALVWRADISRVSDELIVQRARGESFMSAMRQVDELKAKCEALEKRLVASADLAQITADLTSEGEKHFRDRIEVLEKALREIRDTPTATGSVAAATLKAIANAALAGGKQTL